MTYSSEDEELKFVFWRETCGDGSGEALLLRVTPTAGTPFLCSSSFSIVQDGVQRNDIKLQTASNGSSWCNELYVPTTLIVNQYELGEPQFDPARPLTVYFEGWRTTVTVEVATDVKPDPTITAALRGYARSSGTCVNVTTGQSVSIGARNAFRTVNCRSAGLRINAGDRVRITMSGEAN